MKFNPIAATKAVIRVGAGRGFVVDTLEQWPRRLVITAAHCLPHFPESHAAWDWQERTYQQLLGLLGTEPDIWAECLFADPIGDIAVLGPVDNQELSNEAAAFDHLVNGVPPLSVSLRSEEASAVFLLSLDREWQPCQALDTSHGPLSPFWLTNALSGIRGGMSGSPILNEEGAAIGIVATSSGGAAEFDTEGGPNPNLVGNLPGWCRLL